MFDVEPRVRDCRRQSRLCGVEHRQALAAPVMVLILAACGLAQSPVTRGREPIDLSKLTDQVGSGRFAEREAATRRLTEIETARAAVERLSRSGDAEVAKRAQCILAEHDRLYAKTRLERYFGYGREGQIERMVEGLTRWKGPIDNEEFWNDLRAIAVTIVSRLSDQEKRFVSVNDFLQNAKRHNTAVAPVFFRVPQGWTGRLSDGGYLTAASKVNAPGMGNATVVSAAPISLGRGMATAIVFTIDDFETGNVRESRVGNCLIVSAGRVVLCRDVSRALVLARDDIELRDCGAVDQTRLISRLTIKGTDKFVGQRKFAVEADQSHPLGFIQWFETSTVGFEADAAKSGIKVTSVIAKSVADVAGLHAEDVITQIDGQPVKPTKEEFRKQLRRGSVQDACDLTVLRAGKTETVVLDFTGDNKK